MMSRILIASVVIVVAILVSAFMVVPYMTRAESYANDPNDPPEEAFEDTDGDGVISDEEKEAQDPSPDWMGQFEFKTKITLTVGITGFVTGDVSVGDIEIKDTKMNLEPWDGDPWESGSFFAGWLSGEEKYEVEYEITISKSRTTYTDEGSYFSYKDDEYKTWAKTGWFFFWKELEGNWAYDLTVKCAGETATSTGTIGISDGGAYVS